MTSSSPRTAWIRRSIRSTKRKTPVSIVLALDASGSMRKTADALMAAARTFVESLRPAGQAVAALLLRRRASWRTTLAPTVRPASMRSTAYKPVGGTALYDGLAGALDDAESRRGPARGRRHDRRPRREQSRHSARKPPHAARGAGARERSRRDGSANRAGHQSRSRAGSSAWRTFRAGWPTFRRTRRSCTRSLRERSKTCGAATCSATPRHTSRVTGRGGMWRSSRGRRIM